MHVQAHPTLKKLVSPRDNVNSLIFEFGSRFGHYCQTSIGYHRKLSPQHIAPSRQKGIQRPPIFMVLMRDINDPYLFARLPVGVPTGPAAALVREHSASPSTLITRHIVNKLGRI